MTILVAPNAFKGSLTAEAAAGAMAAGAREAAAGAGVACLPVADGGDGFSAVLAGALAMQWRQCPVQDALGRPVTGRYLYAPERRLAVLELAQAVGLARLRPHDHAPLDTHTFGLGQLLLDALDAGARDIVLGVGGSASTDGGMGLACALGVVFRDRQGQALPPGGRYLGAIAAIDTSGLDPRLARVRLRLACDVDNPLLGPRGSARVFAPQKGAGAAEVAQLERGLAHYAGLLRQMGAEDVAQWPGGGAAGGLAAGLRALLAAELHAGAELVLELLDFDAVLAGASLVLTGEGRLDPQSLAGKAPVVVARHARRLGVPCIALVGELAGDEADFQAEGMVEIHALCDNAASRAQAMARPQALLRTLAARVVSEFRARAGA